MEFIWYKKPQRKGAFCLVTVTPVLAILFVVLGEFHFEMMNINTTMGIINTNVNVEKMSSGGGGDPLYGG